MELHYRDYLSLLDKHPSISTLLHCSVGLVPIWAAVLVGLLLGWAWRPNWVSLLVVGIRNRPRLLWTSPPGFGARRVWLAITAFTVFQMLRDCWLSFKAWKWPQTQRMQPCSSSSSVDPFAQCSEVSHTQLPVVQAVSIVPYSSGKDEYCSPRGECVTRPIHDFVNMVQHAVVEEDFKDLHRRFLCKEGGLPWDLMMQRAISGMSYQAWRRDPQGGPTEYKSRTVFEDASPDIVKDFYWDDEFRAVWDDMLIYTKSLEVCTKTGAEIAHWIRKFPFFCSDREYLIGRRIFECGETYFCITKGVPYSAIPRGNKPRRVDVYYSSWCVRAVESSKTGLKTACEVTFFHSEDMGIPKEIAKFGVKQGMWGCVKKMEPGIRKYQVVRKSSMPLSHNASMAQIITKVPLWFSEESNADVMSYDPRDATESLEVGNSWKWIVVGGAVVLACSLDRGIVSKALVFGVAKRLGKLARRL